MEIRVDRGIVAPPPVSDETRMRIEEGLRNWTNAADSDVRARFEAAQAKWDQILQPLKDAIVASERLTEKDFAIRLTLCGKGNQSKERKD